VRRDSKTDIANAVPIAGTCPLAKLHERSRGSSHSPECVPITAGIVGDSYVVSISDRHRGGATP